MKYIITLLLIEGCTSLRTLRWMTPNLSDVNKFESIEIPKSTNPYNFIFKLNAISEKRKKYYDSMLNYTKTNSFLILHDNKIIYQYFNKKEDSTNLNLLFSISKSFVSSLIGIALKEGHINSLSDPITIYLPSLLIKDTGFKKISIQMCLDMQSNIQFDERKIGLNSPLSELYYGKNLNKTLSKIKATNFTHYFEYQNVNTQILMKIIEKASNKDFLSYFNEKIWQPMGAQFPAKWLIDSKKNKIPKAFAGLVANIFDVAKFGYLFANNGQINNIQVIDTAWINTTINFEKNYTKNYTNHWWMNHKVFKIKTEKEANDLAKTNLYKISKIGNYFNVFETGNCLVAEGILDQYMYVYPSKKLVIVRLGDNIPKSKTNISKMIENLSESF